MLRRLLSERFQLAFHREPKELSIYTLRVAKEGPKLKVSTLSPDATPEGPPPLIFELSPTMARLPARYAMMAEFASVLQRSPLDRPVVDRTGPSGKYDFDLEFSPDGRLWGGTVTLPEKSDKPDLFRHPGTPGSSAGSNEGPMDALIIDHIERPSEN